MLRRGGLSIIPHSKQGLWIPIDVTAGKSPPTWVPPRRIPDQCPSNWIRHRRPVLPEPFFQNWYDNTGMEPTSRAIQLEACRTIFAFEDAVCTISIDQPHGISWLRDLIMSSPEIAQEARFGPIRQPNEAGTSFLKKSGQRHLFEQCSLETQLCAFVAFEKLIDGQIQDIRVQNEACEIIRRTETHSGIRSERFLNWMIKLIYSSTSWLSNFKDRNGVYALDSIVDLTSDLSIDPHQNSLWSSLSSSSSPVPACGPNTNLFPRILDRASTTYASTVASSSNQSPAPSEAKTRHSHRSHKGFMPGEANFYNTFVSDLKRWVAATMSPRNPNSHIPSNEEIQHQARWIMYNGDDAWNQTPADHVQWLQFFKRDVGITE